MARLLAIMACLFLPGVAFLPASAAAAEKYFPKETDLILSLNVRQVLDSPVVKTYALDLIKTTLAGNKGVEEVLKAVGIDLLTDIGRMTIGGSLDDLKNPKGVVVIEGKFDVQKINAALDERVKKDPKQFGVEKVSGKTVFRVNVADFPDVFAAAIDSNTIVMSTAKEHVATAFDAATGTRKPELKKELVELLAKADANASLSLVAYTKGKLDNVPLPDGEFKKIISISGTIKVEKNMSLELVLGLPAAEDARRTRLLVGAALDLYKIQAKTAQQQQEFQPLIELLGSLSAVQKDRLVVIAGKLSGEAIEKSLKKK